MTATDPTSPLDRYREEAGRYDLLSREEEADLARTIRRGEEHQAESALRKLVSANLRFVISIAREYRHRGLPLSDLVSEGNLGLVRAARTFDPERGVKFVSYAGWAVRRHIIRALREHGRTIRIPADTRRRLARLDREVRTYRKRRGRRPTVEELAGALDLETERVRKLLRLDRPIRSLFAPIGSKEEGNLLDVLSAPDESAHTERTEERATRHRIRSLLQELPERARMILRDYFGIGRERALNLEEIGRKLDLTAERVRQIKEEALETLREQTGSAR